MSANCVCTYVWRVRCVSVWRMLPHLQMTFVKISIGFLNFLSLWWCFNLLAEYDYLLKEEHVPFMTAGEKRSAD